MEKSVFDRLLTEYKELETTKLRDFLINKIDKTSIDNLNKDLLIAQGNGSLSHYSQYRS